jgi:ABC-type transporter Mla subunit MlaD
LGEGADQVALPSLSGEAQAQRRRAGAGSTYGALRAQLDQAQRELNSAVDRLSGGILNLDSTRALCRRLADQSDDLVGAVAYQHPSVARAMAQLGQLLRALEALIAKLSAETEDATASAGRVVDKLASFCWQDGPTS